MRILVTGATGLIGCHAAARLVAAGHEVHALVRDPAKLRRVLAPFPGGDAVAGHAGNVNDPASVEQALAGCDGLLHCAGLFSHELRDAALLQSVNVRGALDVMTAAVQAKLERIVYVSSALALFPPAGAMQRASDPVASPRTLYAFTKAAAERRVRALQEAGGPVLIVYPSSVLGPYDPTLGSGPRVMADALRAGRILVTDGGLAHTDARDLADLVVALFAASDPPARLMSSATFLTHERYFELLRELSGRSDLKALRFPGAVLRLMGRAGNLAQRMGRRALLTGETAQVLTRSVPVDDAAARSLLGREPFSMEASLRDTLGWMHRAGILEARHVGRLALADPA